MELLAAAIPAASDAVAGEATNADWVMLFVYLAMAIGVSFLCSLTEAGILSIPVSHVHVLSEQGKKTGLRLEKMKANIDRPLAAILTLNTVAHTIGAAGVGAQILIIFGNQAVALGSIIVTLLILIFSEIIPKSLGAAHAKRLAPFTAIAIQGMIWLTYLLIVPLQYLSQWFGGSESHTVTRDEVAVAARLGVEAGELHRDESKIIANLLKLRQVTVEDIMTPRPVIFSLKGDRTVADAVEEFPRLRFSRIPVIGEDIDNILGHVTRHQIMAANNEGQGDKLLSDLARSLVEVNEERTVAETLDRMVEERQHLMLVVDEFGGTAGVVTQEDCIETLLGVEIVDETDSVDDMREAARRAVQQRREERLADTAPSP
jgi:CBS domain containing-hemolysin-like protein